VLANKKPLVDEIDVFQRLQATKLGARATVGAGLPVIPVVERLKKEGKIVKHAIGCLSGSLGVLCGKLGAGEPFSKALDCVRMNGFTEPDPRVDLIGKDMLRKMIIITRFAGHDGGCKKIVHSPMLPKDMSEHTVDEFMKRINCFDDYFKRMYDEARMEGKTIKFVVQFDDGVFRVGLKSVAFDSHIGCLQEAQKLIILTTENGEEIIVEGRGSGAISAAANVLEDVLALSV